MQEVAIVFPHQLYRAHPALHPSRMTYIIEETLFFRQYNFHKQKLILHRASMKTYEDYLTANNYPVTYIDTVDARSDVRRLVTQLAENGTTCIHFAAVTDNWLGRRLETTCKLYHIQLMEYASPNYLNTMETVAEFFDKQKTYFQTDFYIAQRKQRSILLEKNNTPLGGKWSYDADNRLKFPKKEIIPLFQPPQQNNYVAAAQEYIEQHFGGNYGNGQAPFKGKDSFYPVNFAEAEKWLDDFLQHRFSKFGVYEDAIVAKESFLYHSVLTPALNIGLLHPQQIIDKALDAAIEYAVPLNSVEGFIRQLMGWREFIRIVYVREGSRQRTKNYWGFTRKIPASFWTGETGILPVDTVIKKILYTGYSHHIERLMVLGNFMLLCEFNPDEVYKWFMEMYIDSYDWVMVPNVYGMTQFADGGLMTTKPYISGSNYLMKMGDFEKGDWQQVWDGLFWRFMHVHRGFFLKNPRLGMLINTFDKMDSGKKQVHLQNAETFLQSLDNQHTTT
ncbi:MAG: cryptochrome/photolyase family protein [Chitinophagaceae bacterium]